MVTSNPAEYYRFDHLGWLAPGYQADVLCFDDLSGFEPARVWQAGKLVAMNGAIVPGAVPQVRRPGLDARLGPPRDPARTERIRPICHRSGAVPR